MTASSGAAIEISLPPWKDAPPASRYASSRSTTRCAESAYALAASALPAADVSVDFPALSTAFSIFSSAAICWGSGSGPPTNE